MASLIRHSGNIQFKTVSQIIRRAIAWRSGNLVGKASAPYNPHGRFLYLRGKVQGKQSPLKQSYCMDSICHRVARESLDDLIRQGKSLLPNLEIAPRAGAWPRP
jgi:hypothetical protein